MKQTLLQKSLNAKGRKQSLFQTITDEHIEVAIAWMKDEITPTQVAVGLGMRLETGNYQRHLARFLKEAYKRGKLKAK